MGGDEDTSNSQLSQTQQIWKEEMERGPSQTDVLQAKLSEITSCVQESGEDAKKELEVLWRRVRTTTTLLTYLESKARIMTIPHLALTSCGIKQSDEKGYIDRSGTPISSWSGNVKLSNFEFQEIETWIGINRQHGTLDEQDGSYMGEILNRVQTVTDVMESLSKRVLVAESESTNAKQKVTLGQEEIKNKAIQIKTMSDKLDEMDRFARGTNCILNDMRQRVEDLVEETSRQRQRAAKNEQELARIKQDFESLKSYVISLVSVIETLLSSEKQFRTIERLFEWLVVKTTKLETKKIQKEAEVQKLMDENMKLSALLDKKEAQLLAMSEQCKVMALGAASDI